MFSCVSINNIDYLYNKDISLFCVSVEDVQCVLWLSRLDLISSSLAHFTFPSEVAKPRGWSPSLFASSLLLSVQKITIWGFLECWRASHPLADLRQKPCFDFPAGFIGSHRSLDRWTTRWMVKQNLVRNCEVRELGFRVPHPLLSSSLPFSSTLPNFQISGTPHLHTQTASPSRNPPLGRFCVFYQTSLVPRFCIFILSSSGWDVLRAPRLLGVGKAGRRGAYSGILQLWVMRSREEMLNSTPAPALTLPDT